MKESTTRGDSHQVVVNYEEQYSIWPTHVPVPDGWRPAGFVASRDECLDYIEEVWTDIRPASVRSRAGDAG